MLAGLRRQLKCLAAQYRATALPDGRENAEDRSAEEMFTVKMEMISRRKRDGDAN